MGNKIYICHTVYHVFIAMLKAYKDRRIDILLIDTINNVQDLGKRLVSSGIFQNVIIINRKKVFGRSIRTYLGNYINNRLRMGKISINLSFLDKYSEVFIFNDYSEIGDYLEQKKIKYHLLEDGLDTFKQFNQYEEIGYGYRIKKILYTLFEIPFSVGLNKNCLDIEVNDNDGLKTKLIHPVIVQNRKVLLESLSKEYLQTIFEAFGVGKIILSNNKLLLLTQVLKEIFVVNNDKEQIELYKNALLEYGGGYDIYIKPHPRDTIDYSEIEMSFNAVCLDRNIPMEVYSLLPGMNFKVALTYSSTAANNDLAEKIIRLDNRTEI